MIEKCKNPARIAATLLMFFQIGCASNTNQNDIYVPPVAQANYCSEHLCLALAPLFKEEDFITPDITKLEVSDLKVEYSLDYKSYGLIKLEVFQKNDSLPCTGSEAIIGIKSEQHIAYDVNCLEKTSLNGEFLKITYSPNNLNEVDEFKFLSLISHLWLGYSDKDEINGKSSLSLKFL